MKSLLTCICLGAAVLAFVWALRSARSMAAVENTSWPQVVRSEGGAGVRVEYGNGTRLILDAPPTRILPGNAAWVDYLSVLVGPERVCAVPGASDEYSRLRTTQDGLEAWRELPRFSGYGAEIVLSFEPDLVLVHEWQKADVTALLRSEGIPIVGLPLPTRWKDVEKTLELLGALLGVEERAAAVIENHRTRIATLRRRMPREKPRALSYTNLGAGGTVAGAGTTADILFDLAGLENAAAQIGLVKYPALDLEGLLRLDPDVIVVDAAHSDATAPPTAAFLYAEKGLQELKVIRERRVIALSTELFTSCSQELLTGAERLVDKLLELGF